MKEGTLIGCRTKQNSDADLEIVKSGAEPVHENQDKWQGYLACWDVY